MKIFSVGDTVRQAPNGLYEHDGDDPNFHRDVAGKVVSVNGDTITVEWPSGNRTSHHCSDLY